MLKLRVSISTINDGAFSQDETFEVDVTPKEGIVFQGGEMVSGLDFDQNTSDALFDAFFYPNGFGTDKFGTNYSEAIYMAINETNTRQGSFCVDANHFGHDLACVIEWEIVNYIRNFDDMLPKNEDALTWALNFVINQIDGDEEVAQEAANNKVHVKRLETMRDLLQPGRKVQSRMNSEVRLDPLMTEYKFGMVGLMPFRVAVPETNESLVRWLVVVQEEDKNTEMMVCNGMNIHKVVKKHRVARKKIDELMAAAKDDQHSEPFLYLGDLLSYQQDLEHDYYYIGPKDIGEDGKGWHIIYGPAGVLEVEADDIRSKPVIMESDQADG